MTSHLNENDALCLIVTVCYNGDVRKVVNYQTLARM